MKKGAVEIYKNIVIWVSLFLAVNLFSNVVIEWSWVTLGILQTVSFFVYFGLVAYSVIMLVYILAKRKIEEYIFGFAVPFLLIIIPFIIEMFTTTNAPPESLTYIIFLAILFLYSFYHKLRSS